MSYMKSSRPGYKCLNSTTDPSHSRLEHLRGVYVNRIRREYCGAGAQRKHVGLSADTDGFHHCVTTPLCPPPT